MMYQKFHPKPTHAQLGGEPGQTCKESPESPHGGRMDMDAHVRISAYVPAPVSCVITGNYGPDTADLTVEDDLQGLQDCLEHETCKDSGVVA